MDLVKLFEKKEAARRRLEALAAVNVAAKTAAERVEIDIQYEIAQRDFRAANDHYNNAIRRAVSDTPRTHADEPKGADSDNPLKELQDLGQEWDNA